MTAIIILAAAAVMWFLILKEKHRVIIRHYLIAVTMWAALVGAIALAYYVHEWDYKRKHTIFIGDPNKPSWQQP